ncbi:PREDICTED: uncharacterized protein LOC104720344 [Camelina sativa]|uniref:Uncharacterized protein LOC104720344 n=1 Tax=Camelina sativa TaxID=90675 RepID=A0ABM0U6C7_CAMSA|nr:PREDICTED: uncharacterized protein LOC104720344 [Camelina sativa]
MTLSLALIRARVPTVKAERTPPSVKADQWFLVVKTEKGLKGVDSSVGLSEQIKVEIVVLAKLGLLRISPGIQTTRTLSYWSGNTRDERTVQKILTVFLETNDRVRAEVIPSTLFIPNSSSDGSVDREKVAAYHIVPERLEFADLVSKASRSRLPTLLNGSSILITNNSYSSFTVDGVLVIESDIFVDSFMAIHRIASPLDYTTYGSVSKLKSKWPLFTFMLVTVVVHFI